MKKLLSLIIAVAIVVGIFNCMIAYAYEVEKFDKKGFVVMHSDNLNVHKGPGTEYEKVGSLAKGTIIDITGTTTNAEKEEWYKISGNGIIGFVMKKYITLVDVPQTPDEAFELSIKNFPDSYKDKLRTLHAIYPSWKFTPLVTNLTWETLMNNECVIGRNLLQSPEAWMSFEDGAYNFTDKYWYSFDIGNWRQACEEVIAYYLDPRNFLDGNIYQFLVLSDDGSEYDPKVINEILKGTFMYNAKCGDIATYGEALVKAGKEAGASPYMLAARIKMEQGANGNKLAHGTVPGYEGYYNHFNIGAYAHDGRSAIENGAIYAKNEKRNWNTPYKAILGGAQFLVKNYISVGQNTLYLQKYDVVDGGNGLYGHQHATNVTAAVSGCATLRDAIINANATESPLNFLIPVYEDMPEDYGTLPLKTGNANNLLSSLTVEGGRMASTFNKYTMGYDVFTEDTQITVTANAMETGAKVEGIGKIELKYQINKIPITVTATNGLKRTYVLCVTTSNKQCHGGHIYTSVCDTTCDECEAERIAPHNYDSDCDAVCNDCGETRIPSDHTYTNVCDANCDECGNERVAPHKYDNDCDTKCNDCSVIREVNTSHTYTDVCDTVCDKCFETRVAPHKYDNACDAECNDCGLTRIPSDHVYDNDKDMTCNECGFERFTPGDIDGNEGVTDRDAVYLLYHTFLPHLYPVNQGCDFNKDGEVNDKDAVYLLYHTFLPALYPIG